MRLFQSLTSLDLSNSGFQGEVPPQISYLSKLTSLYLSMNDELSWKETTLKRLVQNATILKELLLDQTDMFSINPNLLGLIFNQSSSLTTLSLKDTGLSGSWTSNILCLPSIQDLDMSLNEHLEGQLPELSCSTSLRILDLSNNQFTGTISAVSSYSLQFLKLCSNKLQGEIPESIFNLANLTKLCLSSNNLSSVVNFQHFSKLQNLDSLSFSHNSQLSLNFESNVNYNFSVLLTLELSSVRFIGFSKLPLGKFPSLTYLDLSNNKLYGRAPKWLLEIDSLQFLDLSHN